MAKREKKKKVSRLQRGLRILYIILAILAALAVLVVVMYRVFIRAPETEEQITFPIYSDSGQNDTVVYTRQEGVYTCLLTGCDVGNLRADTIMLGCFDTNSKTASLISIPRDTLVLRNGKNSKINAIYADGGGEAVSAAVSDLLGVPVDYYISVDLDAFQALVETIGGVYFDVPIDMNYDDPTQNLHIHLSKGYQLLGPEEAMGVVRFRHNNDGTGYAAEDIDRVATQRDFLAALISQTITLSNITKVTELINIFNDYVETNMPLNTMIYFATECIGMDLDTSLETATLPGTWISPYYELTDDEVLDLVNELLPVYTEPIIAEIMNIRHN